MGKKNKAVTVPRKKEKFRLLPYLLLVPSLIPFACFTYYPFIKTIISSFAITTETGEFIKWAGFTNWARLFDSDLLEILGITFKFAAWNLVLTFSIAMVFALISANKVKGSKIYQTLYALPMAIASSPAAAIWIFVYRENGGILNQIFGTKIAWLNNPDTALFAVALVTVWTHVASSYIYLLVGFRNVSDDLIEAARIDGANALVRTFKIMIPMASPQIFFVLFLNIVNAFKAFAQIKLLTNGGPGGATSTLIFEIYYRVMKHGQYEYGCCLAIVLFVVIFTITRIQFLFEKRMVHYQ
ncbi:MAG: sugar ABC transporter permease [Tyzzerella sp.]|nr:sugar ABC transporter permease [Tyzzerella sp.]